VIQGEDFSLISGDNLNIAAQLQHQGGGTITLESSEGMLHQSGKIISETLILNAGNENTGTGGIVQYGGELKASTIQIQSSETVSLVDGINDFDVIQATITAGDFLYTDTDDIAIDKITASGAVQVTATKESILDYSDDSDIDIVSGTGHISLTAERHIRGIDGGDTYLELASGSHVRADSTHMGDINLRTSGDILLENLTTVDGHINIRHQALSQH
jgi:hypothetical protein